MFSSAVLLLHDRMQPFAQRLEHFYEQGVLELDLLPHDKIQGGAAKKIFAQSFLFQIFLHLFKKPKK